MYRVLQTTTTTTTFFALEANLRRELLLFVAEVARKLAALAGQLRLQIHHVSSKLIYLHSIAHLGWLPIIRIEAICHRNNIIIGSNNTTASKVASLQTCKLLAASPCNSRKHFSSTWHSKCTFCEHTKHAHSHVISRLEIGPKLQVECVSCLRELQSAIRNSQSAICNLQSDPPTEKAHSH